MNAARPLALLCLILAPPPALFAEAAGDPVAEFWDWFRTVAPRIHAAGEDANDREQMAYWLNRIRPGLSYEISRESRRATLVLSADGRIGLFSAVQAVVDQAPRIRRWKIRALRARASRLAPVTVEGVTLDPATAHFDLYQDAGRLGVVIYVPSLDPERVEAYRTAARRLMCHAVGERKVGNEVGFVDLDSRDVRDARVSRPFGEFREVFSQLAP